jgi:hypothetical protein
MNQLFAGTWTLVASTFRTVDGPTTYPLGEQTEGMLMYDDAGNMAAQLMRPQRPLFLSGDTEQVREEKVAAAYQGYTAYCGRYTIHPEQGIIVHHVQASLNPNWVGSDQTRYFTFTNDHQQLTLRTPPLGREAIVGELVWQRTSSSLKGASHDRHQKFRPSPL